jgi:uncharacterized protein (UPF0276 family)
MTRALAGIGVGLRSEFAAELPLTQRQVDWLEIVPENWANTGGQGRRNLLANLERWPLVPHSTALSIGGPDPFDEEYLGWMRDLCRLIDAPFFSDHICYAFLGGIHTHELLPLPLSEEAAEHTVARIRALKARFDVPLVFENPTVYATMPGSTMDEATFLNLVLAEADCGMLLDVNNVYVNGQNHGFDPYAFLDRMPLDRVRQLHLAGHTRFPDVIIDSHRGPIIDEVWKLYRYTLARAGRLIPTLIEWDSEIPPLDEVLDEVDRARAHAATALALAEAA